ncbi:hypothetical protein J7E25_05845 [Agromyces sp. ISL-38]|uniref:hypothetical protein n=1 Tax=Agromyces sp. ISL-38 TaxID=2819107 RepID=UPI001BEA21C3|nr:hypothetical protein [Agromyces sp. ISL-38]MBT2498611.1 hypothetical protein [Agromyces sp. ISL-38]
MTLFLVFRRPLVSLLSALLDRMGQLKRLKAPWGVEAEWFEESVEEVEESAEGLPSQKSPDYVGRPESTPTDDIALELASIDPAAAVVTAFIRVERAAVNLLTAMGESVTRSPMVAVRKSERVDPYLKSLILDLSQLRNAAAHHREIDISMETARKYIDAANAAVRELELTTVGAQDDEF